MQPVCATADNINLERAISKKLFKRNSCLNCRRPRVTMFCLRFMVFLLAVHTSIADWVLPTVFPGVKKATTVTLTTAREATVGVTEGRMSGCENNGCECRQTDRMVECRHSPFSSLSDVSLPSDTEILDLQYSSVQVIGKNDLQVFPNLRSFKINEAHSLKKIEPGAFHNLKHIELVSITKTSKLLEIDYGVFGYLPGLKKLELSSGKLQKCPNMTSLISVSITPPYINLDHNEIDEVVPFQFSGMKILRLSLDHNRIKSIPDYTFAKSEIVNLSLSANPISTLGEFAFAGIKDIKEIILSHTDIDYLPTEGLTFILTLDIFNTPRLTKFPSIFRFESIQVARLHYFSHCCAFSYMTSENYKMAQRLDISSEKSVVPCPSTSDTPTTSETSTVYENPADADDAMRDYQAILEHEAFGKFRENYPDTFNAHHGPYGDNPPPLYNRNFSILPDTFPVLTNPPQDKPVIDPGFFVIQTIDPNATHTFYSDSCNRMVPKNYSKVQCSPQPDSFNPCSDVMEYSFLRICVWFIALTALAGNGVVVLVLISQKRKMTVPKFLMCNLAFADFCMGVYLLLVAAVDVHTLGEYLNYTIGWQYGAGCKIAGFISMFSSELSVFTLTVITIERWYTIIYAIDLNKRIRLRLASRIMVGGWLFSVLVAMLPFVGIGNYGTTSMCLPFYVKENASNTANVIYVTSILMINAFAFLTICACYIKMYVTVRNPNMVMKRKDSKVAKRMAILVFTDFACWAPIAIFGIAGAFGRYILTTDQSKILIVLFYPINSCANPFLYAIFTKSFRRDFFMLLAKHGMCERRAMKYRPTVTSGPRSMSQINSSTMMRDNVKNVGYHRDSSASVITGVTESRASVVSMLPGNGSPHHSLQKAGNQIPMSPLAVSSTTNTVEDPKEGSGMEPSQEKLLAGNESLETVPEEVTGDTRESDRPVKRIDSDAEEPSENRTLVNRPRDSHLSDKEVKRWRRADSGIHSIPSPSDDEDDGRTFVRNNGSDRNYETVF